MAGLLLLSTSALAGQSVTLSARVGTQAIPLSVDSLPLRFAARAPQLARALAWRAAQPGLSWSEIELSAGTLRIPLRAIIVKFDPRQFDVRLALLTRANRMTGAWNVDSVADDVVLAFNAGQFKETGPWGWLVLRGYESRPPGFGPLSAALAFDTAGTVRWLRPADMARARSDRSIRFAFQSYPLLLFDNEVPRLLLASDDVDRRHRDARLILGTGDDGSLLLVLTRFDAVGDFTERIPVGLTVPESVVLMAALGARHALMLDGGISAQLLLRDSNGIHKWRGLRTVPLAFLARPRDR